MSDSGLLTFWEGCLEFDGIGPRRGAKNTFDPRRATEGHGEHLFDPRRTRRDAENTFFCPRRHAKGHGEHLHLSAKGREEHLS